MITDLTEYRIPHTSQTFDVKEPDTEGQMMVGIDGNLVAHPMPWIKEMPATTPVRTIP